MGDIKWPAVAIQSILLAGNIAFLLDGLADAYIIASTTCISLLFMIQILSGSERFLYLFPISRATPANIIIKTPSYDTLILRSLIGASIIMFFIGATHSTIGTPLSLLLACFILLAPIGFLRLWHAKFVQLNDLEIRRQIDLATGRE